MAPASRGSTQVRQNYRSQAVMPALLCVLAAAVVALTFDRSTAQTIDERQEWKERISQARARAEQARQEAQESFARRKANRPAGGSEDFEEQQARQNSDAVRSDSDLQPGDIISTVNGMLMFRGRRGTERSPTDFVPYRLPGSR